MKKKRTSPVTTISPVTTTSTVTTISPVTTTSTVTTISPITHTPLPSFSRHRHSPATDPPNPSTPLIIREAPLSFSLSLIYSTLSYAFMTIDKSWTTLRNRTSSQFNDGLDAFLERCKDHLDEYNSCWCPCRKCNNNTKCTLKEIDHDIVKNGFSASYTTWDHHGEPPIVNLAPETYNDMVDFLHDVGMENTNEPTHGPSATNEPPEGPSTTKNELEELLAKADEKLYTGCDKSTLHYLSKLLHIKNKFEQTCLVCGESRWKNKNTKGKKVPKKVLRYFPLTPRLRRMYNSRHIAKYMTWHATGKCKEDGKMCHPVDGKTWKDFDQNHKQFALEPRNVRLGLAADGFNPFGNLSQGYSMWPVILTTYNLPPWLCMKESNLMLSMLIPGPKSPGKDIDVFLRPLIEELKTLWGEGVRMRDAATETYFTMKAMLLWTINDYPARSYLSGWSGQGYLAFPTCNKDTPSTRVLGKIAYAGHRRFLPKKHRWRKDKSFNDFGLIGAKRKRDIKVELNWSKRSIFYELEYWSDIHLKHNLDVMHIEKNVTESFMGTLLMNDKSKDTPKARKDLEKLGIRKELWLADNGKGKLLKPHPQYSFTNEDRHRFCQFIKGVKLPDGFGSNFRPKVTDNDNITGMKSHDYHIMMQRLLPVGVRGYLDETISRPIIELCSFLKQLCSRNLMVSDMLKAK
ncbi:uncharacterized protein Tco_0215174, partial [Tanacetum coccineum]